jgi:3-hydroxyacyl-CoA dehydrogenase/enoyl-CoA hydratase/3-hydroxybutyryl-CoA epimerase
MPLPTHTNPHNVITLTLRQEGRPVVVLDHALLREIDAALSDIAAKKPAGFVLASEGRVYIAGANLEEIMKLSDAELHDYLRFGQQVFGKIAKLPCTSVAAIHGAVLGGGLEIAMHCDRLIGLAPQPGKPDATGVPTPAKPYAVGLPEAGLNICPGWGGTNMLAARIDPKRAIEMTATGKPFTCIEAAETGLFEQLVAAPADLLPTAQDLARQPRRTTGRTNEPIALSNACDSTRVHKALDAVRTSVPPSPAAEAVFDCIAAGLAGGPEHGWQACLDREREHLVRLRSSPEGKAAITAFFEKSKAK